LHLNLFKRNYICPLEGEIFYILNLNCQRKDGKFYIRKWDFIGQEGINFLINIISQGKIEGKED